MAQHPHLVDAIAVEAKRVFKVMLRSVTDSGGVVDALPKTPDHVEDLKAFAATLDDIVRGVTGAVRADAMVEQVRKAINALSASEKRAGVPRSNEILHQRSPIMQLCLIRDLKLFIYN